MSIAIQKQRLAPKNAVEDRLGPAAQDPDSLLAVQAARGNREAFATLYRRYFLTIFDFTARITRDADLAADVVRATFVTAWQHLRRGKKSENIKAWLYTLARTAAIDALRSQARLFQQNGREADYRLDYHFAVVDSNKLTKPLAVLADPEFVELVWYAAATLNPNEYALLDLDVRQSFSADELAESMGLSKETLFARLSRSKDAFEESVAADLLLRRGRHHCPELGVLLRRSQDTELTRQARWAVREHLHGCPRCQASRQRYPSALTIFKALAPVPTAPGLRELVWLQIADQLDHVPLADVGRLSTGRWLRQAGFYSLLILVVLLAMGAAGLAIWRFWPPHDPGDVHSTTHPTNQPSLDNRITMAWSDPFGAAAYSVSWSQDAPVLPDTTGDSQVRDTRVTSPALAPGTWYFNLRTQAWNGRWTSTVHVGPFLIVDSSQAENNGPIAVSDQVTTTEDASVVIEVIGNDSVRTLALTEVSDPPNGTTVLNPDGTITYTPNPNYNGRDTFTYTVCNGVDVCSSTTVTVLIEALNDSPSAVDDTYRTDEDTPLTVPQPGILANDSDIEPDPLTAGLLTHPGHGILTQNSDGSFSYAPDPEFSGVDSYIYEACDGHGLCDSAIVTVTVNPFADLPVANDDTVSLAEDTAATFSVLGNDTSDASSLESTGVNVLSSPSHGLVTPDGNGTFTYTPQANFNGSDSFTYQLCYSDGLCDPATVRLIVTPVNDPPIANNDQAATQKNTPVVISVMANDNDIDGNFDQATVGIMSGPHHGTSGVDAVSKVTYVPHPGFNGSDSFTYQVCDVEGACDLATVTVSVTGGNESPQANDDNRTTAEGTPVMIDVLANDSDPDGNLIPSSVIVLSGPANATTSVDATGKITYIPNPGFSGSDNFTYRVCDVEGACDLATVTVTVLPAPPPGLHTVTIIGLNPPSPALLPFGKKVKVQFNYSTTEAGGVRIFVRPYAGGSLAPNYAASGSPLYSTGPGNGMSKFTIMGGLVVVDELRVEMWNADQSQLLYRDSVPVNYKFAPPIPPILQFFP